MTANGLEILRKLGGCGSFRQLRKLEVAALSHSGDFAHAKAAYEEFVSPWGDADPDIPVLKQAKTEYAKLQ